MKIKHFFLIFVIFSFCQGGLAAQEEELHDITDTVFSLHILLSATRRNHPELQKLEEEYRRSVLDVKDSWASLSPTIDLQMSGTYMVNPPIGAMYINTDDIINSIQWNGQRPPTRGQRIKVFDGMEKTLYDFQLTLTQPIFTWGKIINAIKLYTQISEIKKNQISQQINQLETELKTRLLSVYYLNKILKIIDEEEGYTSRMVEVSENAEKVGMLLHQEVVDVKIQAKELEIAKQDLIEQMNDQLLELERITGISPLPIEEIDFDFVPELTQEFEQLLKLEPEQLESEILSAEQTSIKMLTQMQEVSKTSEKIARGYENWKPDVALQMSSGYSGSRFPLFEPNWRRKDDYSVNISIGIKTTIWDGGKKIRDISRKMSEVETAEINKTDATSSLSKNFNSQWNAAQVCRMKIEYQDLKIESSTGKIAQKQQLYESGYGSETELLSAKIDLCNAQIEKYQQCLSQAIACLTIEFLRK